MPMIHSGIESQLQPVHDNLWCWTAHARTTTLSEDNRKGIVDYNRRVLDKGISMEGILSIERGTRITSQNGGWSHVVGEKDRSIRIHDTSLNKYTNFLVVDKQPRFTVRITNVGEDSDQLPRIERCADHNRTTLPFGNEGTISCGVDAIYKSCDTTWDLIVPDDWACRGLAFNVGSYGIYNIQVRTHCRPVGQVSANEQVAIECLREMISETEYRGYMRNGFLCVRGQSGKVYQIFRRIDHIRVWEQGRMIEEVCLGIRDLEVPPTDRVVAMKTMIETDEDEIRHCGNVYNYRNRAA